MKRVFFSPDMRDLIVLFESHAVEYLIVGGFAVNYYGYLRMTQDLDFLIRPSKENADRVMAALREFGFGDAGIPRELFEREASAIHLGSEPNRIDLLTRLEGVDIVAVFTRAERAEIDGLEVSIIALHDLLTAKRNSSRARDHADVEELLRVRDVARGSGPLNGL